MQPALNEPYQINLFVMEPNFFLDQYIIACYPNIAAHKIEKKFFSGEEMIGILKSRAITSDNLKSWDKGYFPHRIDGQLRKWFWTEWILKWWFRKNPSQKVVWSWVRYFLILNLKSSFLTGFQNDTRKMALSANQKAPKSSRKGINTECHLSERFKVIS